MKEKGISKQNKIFIALGLVYVIWGSTYLGVKIGMNVLPPMLLASMRFLVGGCILFVFSLLNGNSLPPFRTWKGAAIVGILLSGFGNCGVANALKYMPSGLVALLVATLPGWMILLDALFFSRRKPTWVATAGLTLGFVGMVYLLNPAHLNGKEIALIPTILVFLSSIAWALGPLLSPTFKFLPPPMQSTAVQMIAGGVVSLIFSFFTENNQWQAIQNMTHQTYFAMTYLIFIGSFIGYSAYTWLINNAPAQLTATYAYVNPVVAIFLGWLIVDEHLTARSLTASAIILGGVVLMTLGRKI